MNRSDVLKQCKGLRAEILQVMRDIDRLTKKPMHFAQDSVWASPAHEPYQNMPIPICGNVQKAEVQKELQERLQKYGDMLVELARKQNAAEDFLQTVPSSIDRVILRGYYIDGRQWKDVAADLSKSEGQDYNENRVKKRAQKFFEKN
jgi:hypothetical protein